MPTSVHPGVDDCEPSGSQDDADLSSKRSEAATPADGEATGVPLQDEVPPARRGPSVRRVPRQARSQQTWQAVLTAAGEELSRAGLDNLSTRRIAAAAGLSIGGLYGYFRNKDAIVAALGEAWLERIYAVVDEAHPRHGKIRDMFAYLREINERVIAVYDAQPGVSALFAASATMPVMRELNDRHDARVSLSIGSALQHFAPRAEEETVNNTARMIPLICYVLTEAALTGQSTERERTLRTMWICLSALGTSLLQA